MTPRFNPSGRDVGLFLIAAFLLAAAAMCFVLPFYIHGAPQ